MKSVEKGWLNTYMRISIKYLLLIAFITIICFSMPTYAAPQNTGDINYTVGQVETVFKRKPLKDAGLVYWPDGSIGVVKGKDGVFAFYAANGEISSSMMTRLAWYNIQHIYK
jgi:hypothetical protein